MVHIGDGGDGGDGDGGGDGAAKVNHTYAYLEGLYAIINEKQVGSLLVSAVYNNSTHRSPSTFLTFNPWPCNPYQPFVSPLTNC